MTRSRQESGVREIRLRRSRRRGLETDPPRQSSTLRIAARAPVPLAEALVRILAFG
jgi:hypothetical protein